LAREVGEDIGGLVTIDVAEGANDKNSEAKEDETEREGKKKKKAKKTQKKEDADHEFLMK
jgi:protein KRI1